MTHPHYIREKALELRRERKLTIDEISDRLALPRGTIYSWVRDIEIPRKPGNGFSTEAQRLGTKTMQRNFEQKRESAYWIGRHSFHGMCELDSGFRDFVSLYIGEGYKRDPNTVSIANSDPEVIALAYRWILRLTHNKVACRVQYHADQDTKMLKGFWANRLGLTPEEIQLQPKSNSGRLKGRVWRCQFGVMAVRVGDTQLRARLQGWIDEMHRSWLDSATTGRSSAW